MACNSMVISLLVVALLDKAWSQTTPAQSCAFRGDDSASQCFGSYVTQKLEQLDKFEQLVDKIAEIDTKIAANTDNLNKLRSEYNRLTRKADCQDIYLSNKQAEDGIYTIYPSYDLSGIQVYCDFDSTGGWLVFQRRQDGSVNFTRNWDDYRDGFGNLEGEHWLGNAHLHDITNGIKRYRLRVDLGDWQNENRQEEYQWFHVGSEDQYFKLNIGAGSGSAGDGLLSHNRTYFTTPDQDHDGNGWLNCGDHFKSGWWFFGCGFSFLNNPYHHSSTTDSGKGIVWGNWHGSGYSLKRTEMKIQPFPRN